MYVFAKTLIMYNPYDIILIGRLINQIKVQRIQIKEFRRIYAIKHEQFNGYSLGTNPLLFI